MACIFIFRRDLRIADNNTLNLLAKFNLPILPIFIYNPIQADEKINKYFSKHAFDLLKTCVDELNIVTYKGADIEILTNLIKKINIKYIGFNLDYTPFARKRDAEIIKWCEKNNILTVTSEDYTLLKLEDTTPYKIFTPFWKKYNNTDISKPKTETRLHDIFISESNKKLIIGDSEVRKTAQNILRKKFDNYSEDRNDMAADKTTHLSCYIKFGVISIREVYHNFAGNYGAESDIVKELFWRDFYAMTAYYFPEVLDGQVNKGRNKASKFEPNWSYSKVNFEKWCNGETGFPIVDAAMKQLLETGWMHNRARMIVASFLTKDLHVDWREGERYFAQKLIDYDPASNNGGWQWCASTGNDSQPYFRIFSPWRQTQTYDPMAKYIKKWLPDFKNIPAEDIMKWDKKYKNYKYIKPMVSHEEEAAIAIEAFK
jgi:deoxyribodipyrimidine photo-lyase